IVTRELEDTPLIGFAGAPFTLASYMIEGGYSRHFLKTKKLMYQKPRVWHLLMQKISEVTANYLRKQVEAGASAVQLFDSWVGTLSPEDYRTFVLPYSRAILDHFPAPAIHFSTGTAAYLDLISEAGGDVISVDWRISLDHAWGKIPNRAIQGNLDPAHLLKPQQELGKEICHVLSLAAGKPGHVFNLGHGVFPETPVENVEFLVEEVRTAKTPGQSK
ncbi:MAG TPA: uroporphyrinogen decarboxylase family protein, partial [Acidobacteriota bacterium]